MPPEKTSPVLGKDQRIVGRAASFYLHNSACMGQRIAHGAMNLRHAAQAISVLHARIVFQMGIANLAVLQEARASVRLPPPVRMGPRGMNALVKSDRRSF